MRIRVAAGLTKRGGKEGAREGGGRPYVDRVSECGNRVVVRQGGSRE